jgi:hypothetical protein
LIRYANKYDIDKIIELLKDFAITTESQLKGNPLDWSKTYVMQLITNIIAGQGFILIDDEQTGILIAFKNHCFWNDKSIQLQEVMLHGYNKFVIARLIKEYIKIAKDLLRKMEINQATMSSYNDLKFERYGMQKLEYIWEIK